MTSHKLGAILKREMAHLTQIKPSDRPWEMPFAAALAFGAPLLIGAWFGRLDYGLISAIGGLAFAYLPETPLHHRMVWMMASAFGIVACYALGVLSHQAPPFMMATLTFSAILVTMVCRFYNVGIPGSFFFIMAAAIGAYSPGELIDIPLKVGLVAMGSLLASLIAFFYSVYILRRRAPKPAQPIPAPTFDFVVFDSVVIGAFVGLALLLAQLLRLENAYWVPVSCLAVIQGVSLRAVWERQLHRVLGTAVGLVVSWGVLALPLGPWSICFAMIGLIFVIESAVVRHYGIAAIFITPLTILLADAYALGQIDTATLVRERFLDTLLGCAVGLLGGVCLHSPRFRSVVGGVLRRLGPTDDTVK